MAGFDISTRGSEVVDVFSDQIKEKTFAITGPSAGGLGAQTAILLAAAQPAEILLLGRSESKVSSVISEIKSKSPSTSVRFIQLDLGDFSSIHSAAATINETTPKLDVLINNAGIMGVKDYTLTKDGLESQFGANHVGHFLLTNLLMPKILAAGKGARIVNLSSIGHQLGEMRWDDYNFSNGKEYEPWASYGQSKTANILFAISLAKKLGPKGVLAYSLHPGGIRTNLGDNVDMSEWPKVVKLFESRGVQMMPEGIIYKDLDQGTATTLVAALDPSIEKDSGAYLDDCKVSKTADYASDPESAEKLWMLSEKIVGQKFEY